MNVADMLQPREVLRSPQQTPEWYQQRIGKLTASRMAAAMSFLKNGQESAERRNLKMEIVAERLTDIIIPHYVTEAMAWGIQTEPEAKEAARRIIGVEINPCGFFDHPTIDSFGATPDALINHDGLLEIKCPTTTTHLEWLLANRVPEEYKPQMVCQLIVTGRRYCQFLSFDPRVRARPLLYKRFAPSQQERDRVEEAARVFLAEVDELFFRVAGSTPPQS